MSTTDADPDPTPAVGWVAGRAELLAPDAVPSHHALDRARRIVGGAVGHTSLVAIDRSGVRRVDVWVDVRGALVSHAFHHDRAAGVAGAVVDRAGARFHLAALLAALGERGLGGLPTSDAATCPTADGLGRPLDVVAPALVRLSPASLPRALDVIVVAAVDRPPPTGDRLGSVVVGASRRHGWWAASEPVTTGSAVRLASTTFDRAVAAVGVALVDGGLDPLPWRTEGADDPGRRRG